MKKLTNLVNYLLISCIYLSYSHLAIAFDAKKIEEIKSAIVMINTRVPMSAYGDPGNWIGTGFIHDKNNGYIITNNHVIGKASIGSYLITFHNGQQAEAYPLYYDIWQDYAILKIDPVILPASSQEIKFTDKKVQEGDQVHIVGMTEAQDFSFHSGYVSNLYDISGQMPQGTYSVNLNSAGGSSGSPLLDDNGEAIGVVYGGGKTYSLALKGSYVQKAAAQLKTGKVPSRKHTGALTEIYSLSQAVQHRDFPKELMEDYIKKYPEARGRVIAVQNMIANSVNENIIKAGDIVWQINDKFIGPDLALFDQMIDENKDDKIELTIYRDGKKIVLKPKIYDVNQNKVHKMIKFGGAIFFEADDFTSAKSGVPLNSLVVKNIDNGGSFSTIPVSFMRDYKNFYIFTISSINNRNVQNLDGLAKVIPSTIKKKFFNIYYKNYQPYIQKFDEILISSHSDCIADITLDNSDLKPQLMRFDQNSLEWIVEDIK